MSGVPVKLAGEAEKLQPFHERTHTENSFRADVDPFVFVSKMPIKEYFSSLPRLGALKILSWILTFHGATKDFLLRAHSLANYTHISSYKATRRQKLGIYALPFTRLVTQAIVAPARSKMEQS